MFCGHAKWQEGSPEEHPCKAGARVTTQSWTCCNNTVTSLAGASVNKGKRPRGADPVSIVSHAALRLACQLQNAVCAWQAPYKEQCRMLMRQLYMPAVIARVVDDALSPIVCDAELWPCCAARGTCSTDCLMLTGYCASLCSL